MAPDDRGGPRGTASADGTVHVSADVAKSVTAVWEALTRSDQLARWFATVDPPLRPGSRSRADFGDGDFFEVGVVGMTAPTELELEWSFLGLGSPHRVRWTVHERPCGASVAVLDHDRRRPPREAAEMVSGWGDFLVRLRDYLETGVSTRYDVRDDLDGAVDLPAAASDPLSGDAILRWLPVATDGRKPSWFFVIDDQGPRRFPLTDWVREPGGDLTFAVTIGCDEAEAVTPTRCTVTVTATRDGRRLSFRQTGWSATGLPIRRARQLRSRFADTWRGSLIAALDLSAPSTG